MLLSGTATWADKQTTPPAKPTQNQPLTPATRVTIIRSMDAELAFARQMFPMGEKGLVLTPEGKITSPGPDEMARLLATFGPAARPGDRVRITNIDFKGNTIRFEINGGPKKKKKWYEHVQVGGMGGSITPGASDSPVNPRGSVLVLAFKNYVPEMTIEELKKMLLPVLDFRSLSATEAYLDTIPPKAKQAIKEHQVLVGMNKNMVNIALGMPPKKYRDKDENGKEYEEWIYGEPPAEVQFVRFIGDEVVRLEIMKVNGEKVLRTQKDIEIAKPETVAKKEEASSKPMKRPSLKRPGEEDDPATVQPAQGPATVPDVDPNEKDPTMGPGGSPRVTKQPPSQPPPSELPPQ
ncbi:MAG: hypothetical protein JO187_06380 [Acidobacteria bacterium]|nr:hypothetical protein [Acidobacteriota bacterium]